MSNKISTPDPIIANRDAENALLASMMVQPDIVALVSSQITVKDFFYQTCAQIFAAILTVTSRPSFDRDSDLDIVSVTAALSNYEVDGQSQKFADVSDIVNIIGDVPYAGNWQNYLNIVKRLSLLRQQVDFATKIAIAAYEENADPAQVFDLITQKSGDLARRLANINGPKNVDRSLLPILERNASGGIAGYKTGLSSFDNHTRGLRSGNAIYTVAAGEGVGKTTFILNACLNLLKNNVPVGMISLETSEAEVRYMMASALLQQDFSGRVDISEAKYDAAIEFDQKIETKPFKVYSQQNGPNTPQAILAVIEDWARQGMKVIVVDNMSAIHWPGKAEDRRLVMADFAAAANHLVGYYKIHITLIAHLNREAGRRAEPTNDDIAEASAFARLSEVVYLLWPNKEISGTQQDERGIPFTLINLSITKSRNGQKGRIAYRHYFTQHRMQELENVPLNT